MAWDGTDRRVKRKFVFLDRRAGGWFKLRHELIAWTIIAAAVVPFFLAKIEPSLRPIITPLQVESVEPYEGGSRIVGGAERLRDCSFVDLHWYLGREGEQSAAVSVSFLDKPQIREAGKTHWDGIVVNLSPSQIVNNSHAAVEYDCRPWGPTTMQPFYKGDGRDAGLLYDK